MRRLLYKLRALFPPKATPVPVDDGKPRSIFQGRVRAHSPSPGSWHQRRHTNPTPIRRALTRGLPAIAFLALLCAPAPAFPPASQFVTIGGESGLVQVVSAAFYSVHGTLEGFDPTAVHASTSDRLDLKGQLTDYGKRKRYADFALHERRWADLVLDAHYYRMGL